MQVNSDDTLPYLNEFLVLFTNKFLVLFTNEFLVLFIKTWLIHWLWWVSSGALATLKITKKTVFFSKFSISLIDSILLEFDHLLFRKTKFEMPLNKIFKFPSLNKLHTSLAKHNRLVPSTCQSIDELDPCPVLSPALLVPWLPLTLVLNQNITKPLLIGSTKKREKIIILLISAMLPKRKKISWENFSIQGN